MHWIKNNFPDDDSSNDSRRNYKVPHADQSSWVTQHRLNMQQLDLQGSPNTDLQENFGRIKKRKQQVIFVWERAARSSWRRPNVKQTDSRDIHSYFSERKGRKTKTRNSNSNACFGKGNNC